MIRQDRQLIEPERPAQPMRLKAATGASLLEPPAGEAGLTAEEARALLVREGPNRLVPEHRRPAPVTWILRPLADPMVLFLLLAGLTYLVLRDYLDGAVSLAALVPIMLVGLVLEVRAERTLEQLKGLAAPLASVWRDGRRQSVPTEAVVPGDLVFVQEGDVIPADGMLISEGQLLVDESALTGESQPVTKQAGLRDGDQQLFAGTAVLSGRGIGRITVTGEGTRYGRIGVLLASIEQPPTPLQRLIQRLVRQLAVVAFIFCLAVAGLELARGNGWGAAIIAGVSLAMAALPEEFPMVFALYLSLGAWRLAQDHALIRRLVGVETLGSTTVICSDKTGTLTLGRLEVEALAAGGAVLRAPAPLGAAERSLLEAAVLACEPEPFDLLDQAILRSAAAQGLDGAGLHRGRLVEDYPFDNASRYLSHVWERNGAMGIYAKGAVEGLLSRSHTSDALRQRAIEANEALASSGMRVIGVAAAALAEISGRRDVDEGALEFLGLIGFSDPLRPGVKEALNECRQAGIRVIMITGDHPATARSVADGLGLPRQDGQPVVTGQEVDAAGDAELAELVGRANIFARIRPEQKYRLVQALRARGEVVAMTGDGINDAPALREADIGIAMGERGTQVAREAATMVLLDDNFTTIVHAVRDGRRIFENLRRSFSYLIAFHPPLLLAALVIPLTGAPLLLFPIHLVWLELIVHPTSSLVFEADPASPALMRQPPRAPGVGLLTGLDLLRPLALGIALSAGVLAVYFVSLGQSQSSLQARGMAIATLLLGQTILVLVERSPNRPIWRRGLGGNRALPVVLALTVASLLAALYVPALAEVLKLAPLSPRGWLAAGAVAAFTTLWLEPFKGRRGRL